MPANLFVAGFPYEVTQDELAKFFSQCGTVVHVKILTDRDTGRSRGLGFVKLSSDAEGDAAIAKLNGAAMGARTIFVTAAKPPPLKPGEASAGPGRTPVGAADFVERRSGKDRRRQPVGPWDPNDRRDNAGAASSAPAHADGGRWKPSGERKPWDKKKPFGERKPWDKKKSFGEGKPWEKKPFTAGAAGEGKSPAEGKPWEKKKPFGERKPWDKKPGGFVGGKKRFFKPGGFRRS